MSEDKLQPDPADDFVELVVRHLEGQLTDPERRQLNAFLAEDPAKRETFVALCTHACLLASGVGIGEEDESGACGMASDGSGAPLLGTEVPSPHTVDALPSPFIPHSSSFILPLSDVRGWLLSYAVATVVTGLAILGAWTYKVSNGNSRGPTGPGDVVAAAEPSPGPVGPGPKEPQLVGHITGAVDCCCASSGRLSGGAAVRRGDAYQLAAGWLEITYQTGAKVILEGPCAYEVDSASGGFLTLGKLTARVETKGEGGRQKAEETEDQKSEIRNQKSPFPLPPSAFIVRTPTAVVTDLGTEFGVEVDASGGTQSHVFQGKVELRRIVRGIVSATPERLGVGDWLGVDAKGAVTRTPPAADSFVRDLRPVRAAAARRQCEAALERFRTDRALLAYYAFDNERQAPDRLLNRSAATAGRLDGVLGQPGKPETRPTWADGQFSGRRALRFEAQKQQAVIVPYDEAMNAANSLTVAAWVKPRFPLPPHSRVILSRRDGFLTSFQLSVQGASPNAPSFGIQLYTGEGTTNYSGSVLPLREEWWHIAATLTPSYKQFYFNGELVDQSGHSRPPDKTAADLWIGAPPPSVGEPRCSFDGLIGEIWIFKRVLTAAEIRALYELGATHESTSENSDGAAVQLPSQPGSPLPLGEGQGVRARPAAGKGGTMNGP